MCQWHAIHRTFNKYAQTVCFVVSPSRLRSGSNFWLFGGDLFTSQNKLIFISSLKERTQFRLSSTRVAIWDSFFFSSFTQIQWHFYLIKELKSQCLSCFQRSKICGSNPDQLTLLLRIQKYINRSRNNYRWINIRIYKQYWQVDVAQIGTDSNKIILLA